MKKFLILAAICTVAACKQGPIFPDEEVQEVARYDDGTVEVLSAPRVPVEEVETAQRPARELYREYVPGSVQQNSGGEQVQEKVRYIYEGEPGYVSESYAETAEPKAPAKPAATTAAEMDFSPEVYTLLATRATNRLIDETANLHEGRQTPSIYVTQAKKAKKALPNGTFYADRTTKNILSGSKTFNVSNTMQEANYHVESVFDVVEIGGERAVQYKMSLFDKSNKKIKELAEVLKQIKNDDQTWW